MKEHASDFQYHAVLPRIEFDDYELKAAYERDIHNVNYFIKLMPPKVSSTDTLASIDHLRFRTSNELKLYYKNILRYKYELGIGRYFSNKLINIKSNSDGWTWVTLNPSAFINYQYMLQFLSQYFEELPLFGVISLADCALTIPCDFKKVFEELDFGLKKAKRSHEDTPGQEGYYIGKRRKKYALRVYNKQKESKLSHPCTRIEINSFPKGLCLGELSKIQYHTPFSFVSRCKVVLVKPSKHEPPIKHRNYGRLESLVSKDNFWFAKRELNRMGGNFNRVFKNFYKIERINESLDDLFQKGIKKYFNGTGSAMINNGLE